MSSAVVSGTIRVSNNNNVFTNAFSAIVTVSQWQTQQIILANGISDFIVSIATQSNPGFLMLMATSLVRVNFGEHASADSAASLGYTFKDMFAQIGSGQSGPLNIHLANSSGDSATVTLITGM